MVFELIPFLESDPPIVISLKLIVRLYCFISSVRLAQNILGLQVPNLKKFQKFESQWTLNRHKAARLTDHKIL